MNKTKNSDLPLVTLIAVCYNHEKFLVETLDSINLQTYPNIELIIIDDCSQDRSVDIINEWINKNRRNSCNFIAHKENVGLNATLNEALSYTTGKYYQSISCDDIMLPHKIKKQVKALENANNEYALSFADAVYIDENSEQSSEYTTLQTRKLSLKNLLSGEVRDELIDGSFFTAPTVLIKTDIVKDIGGYDESIAFEDWDLWLRLSKNYKFLFLNDVVVKYRQHSNSMSNSFSKDYLKSILEIVKKEYKSIPQITLKGKSTLRKLLCKSSFTEKVLLLKNYSFLIDCTVLKSVFNR